MIEATLDDTVIAWSRESTYDMGTGEAMSFSNSGSKGHLAFQTQQGPAGVDVDDVVTSGWSHVDTIYRDPSNDYACSGTQQAASGMGRGPGADGPGGEGGPSF